jgi:dTDP-4-amino-4,6-dideoxygalactose transaminase
MSEIQALMGELMLDTLQTSIEHGRRIDVAYRERLDTIPGLSMPREPAANVRPNYSFFPVLVDEAEFGLTSDALKAALLRYNVHVRRYFTPLISDMTAFRDSVSADPLENARRIGPQVMALPTYTDLAIEDVHRICDLIAHIQRTGDGRSGLDRSGLDSRI